MALNSKTLRPGLLVGLSTAIKGDNVEHIKTELEAEHVDENGALISSWQTDRSVADAAEYEAAVKLRGKARNLITGICSKSDFGYLCPEANKDALELAIKKANEICDEFNDNARLTEIRFFTITGRIAADDLEAVRAIKGELNNLLEAMDTGIQKLDVAAVREAGKKAKKLGQMLSPDAQKSLDGALDEYRAVATKINAAIKAGDEAAKVIDAQTLAALAGSRTAFLDLDGESEVKDTEAVARALDLDPEIEAAFDEDALSMDTSIPARELDLEDMLS